MVSISVVENLDLMQRRPLIIYISRLDLSEFLSYTLKKQKMDQDFKNELKLKYGIEINEYQKVENNDIFNLLQSRINWYFQTSPLNQFLQYKLSEINTIVETKTGHKLKEHQCITFSMKNGSYIRFSPDENDGIEITALYVPYGLRRQGLGEILMNTLIAFNQKSVGYRPTLSLECTGAIGFGDDQENTPIEDQIKFFQKLGFNVVKNEVHNGYVKMQRIGEDYE